MCECTHTHTYKYVNREKKVKKIRNVVSKDILMLVINILLVVIL